MAAYIPELANSFATLGYSGEDGLKHLIAMLQTLREDTGSATAAATQAQNIFGKMYNADTAKKFSKFGIDLRKELSAARKNGEDAVSAFVRLSKEAIKGDLTKLPLLFTDQEFRLGMQSLITSSDSLERFFKILNSAEVDGAVFRDVKRITGDTQASIDRMAASWDKFVSTFGAKASKLVVPVMDSVSYATDKQDAIDRALKERGMGYLESQWHQVGLSQKDQDLLAIEGGFKDPDLRAKYQFGPNLPEGWKTNEFTAGGIGPNRMVKGKDGRWHNEVPAIGPLVGGRDAVSKVPGRDHITAAMLARRGEIEFANNSASVAGLRPEQRNADLRHLLANLDRVEKGGSGRPWMDDGEKVGTEVGAAAIERMSSDARAVGSEVGSVVQEAMKAIAPQIGAAIAQAFAAGASQVKVGVNMAGGASGKINADTGRTMPASVGQPVSRGG
jgi:hypothetical protein